MASIEPWIIGDSGYSERLHQQPQVDYFKHRTELRPLLVRVRDRVALIAGCNKVEAYQLIKATVDDLYLSDHRPTTTESHLAQTAVGRQTGTTTAIGLDGGEYFGAINPHILREHGGAGMGMHTHMHMHMPGIPFEASDWFSLGQSELPILGIDRSHAPRLQQTVAGYLGAIDGESRLAGNAQGNAYQMPERQSYQTRGRKRNPGCDRDSLVDYSNSGSNLDPQLQHGSQTDPTLDNYIPRDARSMDPSTSRIMGPPSSFTSLSQQSPGNRRRKRTKTVASEPVNETETSSQPGGDRTRELGAHLLSERGNETETSSQAGQDRTCEPCNRTFPFPRDLKAHNQAHHAGGIRCDDCNACLSNQYSLQRHKASKHGVGELCGHCPTAFGTEAALKKHMAKEHGVGTHCNICDRAVTKLERHMADVHNQGYPCKICPRFFATEHSARHHRKSCTSTQHSKPQQQRERRHPPPEQNQHSLDHPGYPGLLP